MRHFFMLPSLEKGAPDELWYSTDDDNISMTQSFDPADRARLLEDEDYEEVDRAGAATKNLMDLSEFDTIRAAKFAAEDAKAKAD